MVRRGKELFTIAGFTVRLDPSWFLIAVLLSWSLATGFFPVSYPNLSRTAYWGMGIVAMLALFASVVMHELAHALVARRYGMPITGITLFIFGGVAELKDEPPSAKAEFWVAVAGPGASVALAVLFEGVAAATIALGGPVPVVGVLGYLAAINLLLVLFNLLPAFPLDGGRVFRAFLWWWKGSLRWATRVTSAIGSGFGFFLMIIGVFSFVRGALVAGIWWFILGMFLHSAARISYRQLLLRRELEGEPVRSFLRSESVAIPASTSIETVVEHYFYRSFHRSYPVVQEGRLVGCVGVDDIKMLPKTRWSTVTAGEIARPCDRESVISSKADAMDALSRMNETGASELIVTEDGHVAGLVALPDLVRVFAMKSELDEPAMRQ